MRRCYRDSRAVGTPSCQWRLRRLLVAGRSEARGFLPGSSSRWDASRSVRRSPGERRGEKGREGGTGPRRAPLGRSQGGRGSGPGPGRVRGAARGGAAWRRGWGRGGAARLSEPRSRPAAILSAGAERGRRLDEPRRRTACRTPKPGLGRRELGSRSEVERWRWCAWRGRRRWRSAVGGWLGEAR